MYFEELAVLQYRIGSFSGLFSYLKLCVHGTVGTFCANLGNPRVPLKKLVTGIIWTLEPGHAWDLYATVYSPCGIVDQTLSETKSVIRNLVIMQVTRLKNN